MKFTTKQQLTNVRPTKENEGAVIKFTTSGGTVKVYAEAASTIGVSNGDRIYFQKGALDGGQFPGVEQIFIAKGNIETGLGQKASYPSDKIRSYMNISSGSLSKAGRSEKFAGRVIATDEVPVYTLGTDEVEDEGMTFRNLVFLKVVKTIKKTSKADKGNTADAAPVTNAPAPSSNVFSAPAVEDEVELEEEEEVEEEL